MNLWYHLNPPSQLLDMEYQEVENLLRKTAGHYLVQLGGVEQRMHAAPNPLLYRVRIGKERISDDSPVIQAEWNELPLQPDSVDIFLLVHVLEQAEYPVKLLKEVYQALKPGGRVIILGFNPWSLLGMRKLIKADELNRKFWSRAQIKYWLHNYHYRILSSKSFYHHFSKQAPPLNPWNLFVSVLGQWCFPAHGGVFMIMAEKRMLYVRGKKVEWWKKQVARGVVGPIPPRGC